MRLREVGVLVDWSVFGDTRVALRTTGGRAGVAEQPRPCLEPRMYMYTHVISRFAGAHEAATRSCTSARYGTKRGRTHIAGIWAGCARATTGARFFSRWTMPGRQAAGGSTTLSFAPTFLFILGFFLFFFYSRFSVCSLSLRTTRASSPPGVTSIALDARSPTLTLGTPANHSRFPPSKTLSQFSVGNLSRGRFSDSGSRVNERLTAIVLEKNHYQN